MLNCRNCDNKLTEKYCATCGQAAELKRIDGHYIIHEIEHILHFEKGILYTIKELLIRPGKSVRRFISDDRNRLVKPIIFIVITSLVYTLINHFFHIEEGYVKIDEVKQSTTGIIIKWVQDHYGYSNIIMGIFIAFWAKIFFRKYNYNFFEILILLCFIMGMGMLFLSVFAIFLGLTHIDLMQAAGILSLIYCTWAIGQFFDKKKIGNYFKAFAAYSLGMISFMLTAVLLGTVIDLIIKH